jgi:hypothetical protein
MIFKIIQLKYLFSVAILLLLSGCNIESEAQAINSMRDSEKVWVFVQFNVPEESDKIETYYYYGLIAKKLYDGVAYNELESGFILLEKVKYWSDNIIHDYKDGESQGELVYRIEDIVKLERINREPIAGKGSEQFKVLEKLEENSAGNIGVLPKSDDDN